MTIIAKYASECAECGNAVHPGQKIDWATGNPVRHAACGGTSAAPASRLETTGRVTIAGDTYRVKDQIKMLGGRWDAAIKAWTVPADRADEARRLVAGAPASPRYPRRDHEDCLSMGPCGPDCEYADLFRRR